LGKDPSSIGNGSTTAMPLPSCARENAESV
jgi:hypothetical protein